MKVALYTAILACALAANVLRARPVEEPAAGFRYEVPDTWQRLPNKKKISDPRMHLDILFLKSERRLVIPCGFTAAYQAGAQYEVETLCQLNFNVRIVRKHPNVVTSKSGVPVTRIWCSTDGSDPAAILLYRFETQEAVTVICACPLTPGAEKECAATYDRLFATLELIKPEHLAELPAIYQGKWEFDPEATNRTMESAAQSDEERAQVRKTSALRANVFHPDLDISDKLVAENGPANRRNSRSELVSIIRDGNGIFAEANTSSSPNAANVLPANVTMRMTEEDGLLTIASWWRETGGYSVYHRKAD